MKLFISIELCLTDNNNLKRGKNCKERGKGVGVG